MDKRSWSAIVQADLQTKVKNSLQLILANEEDWRGEGRLWLVLAEFHT